MNGCCWWSRLFLWLSALAVLGAGEPPPDVSGPWQSDFGVVYLRQDGDRVTGTYSCCDGRLEGELEGDRLAMSWRDPIYGEGTVVFGIEPGGQLLAGRWSFRAGDPRPGGVWSASRLPEPELVGEPSHWRAEGRVGDAGTMAGTAVLYFRGDDVSGRIDAVQTLRLIGQQTRQVEVINYLEGKTEGSKLLLQWRNPLVGSTGTMSFRAEADRLIGRWRTAGGDAEGELTLYRASAPAAPVEGSGSAVERWLSRLEANQRLEEAEGLRRGGRLEEAIPSYRRAIELLSDQQEPDRLASAYYGLGLSCRELGREAEARRAFEKILELGQAVDEALRLLTELALR